MDLFPRWLNWTNIDTGSLLKGSRNSTNGFLKNAFTTYNETSGGQQRIEIYSEASFLNHIPYAEQFGLATAVILILIINIIRSNKEKNRLILSWPQYINPQTLFVAGSFLLFIIIAPIILLVLLFSYANRKIVNLILKTKHRRSFVELLDGTDTIWALEEDNAKSVINVVALVEVDQSKVSNKSDKEFLLNKLKERIASKLFTTTSPYPKMMYKRSFKLGYFFWEMNDKIQIDDFVRPLEFDENIEFNEENLKKFVGEKCNSILPYDNTAAWEILISNKPLIKDASSKTDESKNLYPILFRIHHSLGDGVVLLKLLLKTIADEKCERNKKLQYIFSKHFKKSLDYWVASTPFERVQAKCIHFIYTVLKKALRLILIPACLMNQVLRPPDSNVLHGPVLTGKKIVAWISDKENEESLLSTIKRMKGRIPGATFSDLFLTSVSASYHNYFSQCCLLDKPLVPEYMTAVVPVRMDPTELKINPEINEQPFKLENKFSVAMLTIPINQMDSLTGNNISLLKRLVEVRRHTNKLRYGADFQVNYWLMSVAGHVLPESILRPMMCSEQATLVVSNLPGPTDITICDGHAIRDMVFFVPHRGTTGIGVTLLTCNGRVQLGLMADSALISCSEDAHSILKGAVDQLKNIDAITSRRLYYQESSLELQNCK